MLDTRTDSSRMFCVYTALLFWFHTQDYAVLYYIAQNVMEGIYRQRSKKSKEDGMMAMGRMVITVIYASCDIILAELPHRASYRCTSSISLLLSFACMEDKDMALWYYLYLICSCTF